MGDIDGQKGGFGFFINSRGFVEGFDDNSLVGDIMGRHHDTVYDVDDSVLLELGHLTKQFQVRDST